MLLFELGQKQNGPSEKHVAVGNNAHANCLVESEKHPTTSRNLHICVPVPPKRPHCTHFNQTFSQLVKGSGLSSLKPTIRTYAQKKKKLTQCTRLGLTTTFGITLSFVPLSMMGQRYARNLMRKLNQNEQFVF